MKSILLALTLCSCTTTPTWSNATPQQRANLQFIEDAEYQHSCQYGQDIYESVETILGR